MLQYQLRKIAMSKALIEYRFMWHFTLSIIGDTWTKLFAIFIQIQIHVYHTLMYLRSLFSKGVFEELPVVVFVGRWRVLQREINPGNHHLRIIHF